MFQISKKCRDGEVRAACWDAKEKYFHEHRSVVALFFLLESILFVPLRQTLWVVGN